MKPTHIPTVRTLTRRFRQQGMVGLLPEDVEVTVRARAPRVPEVVRQEIDRLKARYDGFHYRELARILFITCGVQRTIRPSRHSGRRVRSPVKGTWGGGTLTPWSSTDRHRVCNARSSQLYYHGWNTGSMSQYMTSLGRRVETMVAV